MFCTESYQIFSDLKINCVAKYRISAVIVGKTFGYHRTLKVKLQQRTYVTEKVPRRYNRSSACQKGTGRLV